MTTLSLSAVFRSKRKILITVAVCMVVLLSSFAPVQAPTVGVWRLLNPVENTATPTAIMRGVFMLNGGTSGKGSGDGFAVGDSGLIYHWDGFSWTQAGSGTNCPLNSVNFGGPLNPLTSITRTSGWAVGGSAGCAAAGAVSFFYDGVSWTSYPVPGGAGGTMMGVFLVQSGSTGQPISAWAVGDNGANGAFWLWNGVPGGGGGFWGAPIITLDTTRVNSVYMTQCTSSPCAATDGWAVGNTAVNNIFHWTGAAWIGVQDAGVNLNGVAMSSTTRGWAVGTACTILQYTGALWNPFGPLPCSDATTVLNSIVLSSSSEGWAAGAAAGGAGRAVILHGTSLDSAPAWTEIPVNQVATSLGLNSITFAPNGGNLWAVGFAGVAAFCLSNCGSVFGSIWSTTTSPRSVNLNSVFMTGDNDGWAVGDPESGAPTVLRWNGFSWTRGSVATPLNLPLYGVYLSGGSNGWAVGGTVATLATFHFDGNTWTQITPPLPGTYIMRAVYMVSDSNSWAVGSNVGGPGPGAIWHSTSSGGPFTGPVAAPAADLYSVFFDPSSGGIVGYAAGGNGVAPGPTIVKTTDGGVTWPTVWTSGAGLPAGLPATTILRSLFFQDSTHGWAAGGDPTGFNQATILYWNGATWSGPVPIVSANNVEIFGIFVVGGPPANDGWAVGQDRSTSLPVLLHYDTGVGAWVQTPPLIAIPAPNTGAIFSLYMRSSTNGLAVGQTSDGAGTLSFSFHLDPPDGSPPPGTTVTTPVTTTLTTSITSSTSSLTTSTSTSSTSSEATSSTMQTSSTSSSETSSSVSSSTSESSSQVSTITVTPPSTSSTTTPLVMPAVPGFPIESIVAGIIFGLTTLAIVRRRRR